jgi:hypothetical protein
MSKPNFTASLIPIATVTSAGSLATSSHNPVDATAGALTMTLPTPTAAGQFLSAEKYDSSANVVTLSGSIRGATSTISLTLSHETVEFVSGGGSWWPVAGHKTLSSLDGRYGLGWVIAADPKYGLSTLGAGVDCTSAFNAALATVPSGGTLFIGGLNLNHTGTLTPQNLVTIRGSGRSSHLTYTGTGTAVSIPSGGSQVGFAAYRHTATQAGSVLYDVENSFRCFWDNVTLDGQHGYSTGTTYTGQVGITFGSNAGDNRIINCDINNLGTGILAASQMNFLIGCTFGTCWRGVAGGDPTGAAFAAGMSINSCTFHGSPSTDTNTSGVEHHIYVTGTANQWWLDSVWMEKCDKGVEIGASGTSYGPSVFSMSRCRIASATAGLIVNAGVQTRLDSIQFGADSYTSVSSGSTVTATPTDLTVSTSAADGSASNLRPTSLYDFPLSTFPTNWTYFSRSQANSQVSGPTFNIYAAGTAGSASYYQSGGGRYRAGYDGSGTVVTDAGGGRYVALIAGATPRKIVYCDPSGNVSLGGGTPFSGSTGYGTGVGTVGLPSAPTVPTTLPTGGALLYTNGAIIESLGSSGSGGHRVLGHLLSGVVPTGSAPTVASVSSSTSPVIGGNDISHGVSFTTAAGTTAGSTVITITFGAAYLTTPRVVLTPTNAASVGRCSSPASQSPDIALPWAGHCQCNCYGF